ncbi:unnamed protein product [Urochloa humidicola]
MSSPARGGPSSPARLPRLRSGRPELAGAAPAPPAWEARARRCPSPIRRWPEPAVRASGAHAGLCLRWRPTPTQPARLNPRRPAADPAPAPAACAPPPARLIPRRPAADPAPAPVAPPARLTTLRPAADPAPAPAAWVLHSCTREREDEKREDEDAEKEKRDKERREKELRQMINKGDHW